MATPAPPSSDACRALAAHRALELTMVAWRDSHHGLEELVRRMGEALGCPLGSIWTIDAASQSLTCWDFFSAPEVDGAEFERVTRRVALPVGDGIPGRVWRAGEPLISPDIYVNMHMRRHAAARRLGLRSAVAFPVTGASGPIAVVCLYSGSEQERGGELATSLASVGRALGRFVEDRHDAVGAAKLSERELQVLELAAEGRSGPEIADELVLSALTVKSHLARIYAKVGVADRAGAVAYALRRGLIR